MKRATIISLNPSHCVTDRIASLGTEGLRLMRRSLWKSGGGTYVRLIDFLCPTRRSGLKMSLLILSVRLLFAAMLICGVVGVSALPGQTLASPQVFMSVAVLFAAGIFTRPVGFASAVFFGFVFAGNPADITSLYYSVISLICSVAGAGWFSVDSLLRNAVVGSVMRRRRRERGISYKAFRYNSYAV